MKVSNNPEEILTAPNLGSCVGISVYDPHMRIGGLIHCLLPLSKNDPQKAASNPCMYVDTGLTVLFDTILSQGCDKRNLRLAAVGGANINDENNIFEVGKKNITVLKKFLWKNSFLLSAEDFGESVSRTISLYIGNGRTILRCNGETRDLIIGDIHGVQHSDC
jgi:chemotaxis protein CheD